MSRASEDVILSLVEAGVFEIDAQGRIWRCFDRVGRVGMAALTRPCARRRAEKPKRDGYLEIRACLCGKRYVALAHRVVYRRLVGPIPNDRSLNHINGVTRDNSPSNLEPATSTEQTLHAIRVLGRAFGRRPADRPRARMTEASVAELRDRRAAGETVTSLAAAFGITHSHASKIARGTSWAWSGRSQ